jgi:hypothetical protein
MTFKERFPDEAALQTAITASLPMIVDAVRLAAGPHEEKYRKKKQLTTIATTLFIVTTLIIGVFLSEVGREMLTHISSVIYVLLVLFGILCSALGVYTLRYATQFSNDFTAIAHATISQQAFRFLGLSDAERILISVENSNKAPVSPTVLGFLSKVVESPEKKQTLALVDYSELVTEPHNRFVIDDLCTFSLLGSRVFVAEACISHVTDSGKNRHVKEIFRGYFASYSLQKSLTGKTFISTDGDRNGFGHRSFWSAHTTDGAHDTVLEWNEFEDLLHVATTDPVEARTILTPDVMSRLYDWWAGQNRQQNIRLSFLGASVNVLFPSSEVHFLQTIKTISSEDIEKSVRAIVCPLVPLLQLLEVVGESKL